MVVLKKKSIGTFFVDNFMIYSICLSDILKTCRFQEKFKPRKCRLLTLNNFFSTRGIYEDFWHFISTGVPMVFTNI